jgi:hypothetical protein
MIDFFDFIIDGVVVLLEIIFVILIGLLGIITIPLWILPYAIYKLIRGKKI